MKTRFKIRLHTDRKTKALFKITIEKKSREKFEEKSTKK